MASKSRSRANDCSSDSRTRSWSAMPSLPATISRVMPSMSSPGRATIIQAFEKAVWPVRPIIHESSSVTRVPGEPWRLALRAAIRPPAPAPTTSTSVSIRTPSSFDIASPRPGSVLDRGMHVHDLLRAEYLAAEAGDAVLAVLDHGQQLGSRQSLDLHWDGHRLHVDDVRRADGVADAAASAPLELDVLDHRSFVAGISWSSDVIMLPGETAVRSGLAEHDSHAGDPLGHEMIISKFGAEIADFARAGGGGHPGAYLVRPETGDAVDLGVGHGIEAVVSRPEEVPQEVAVPALARRQARALADDQVARAPHQPVLTCVTRVLRRSNQADQPAG